MEGSRKNGSRKPSGLQARRVQQAVSEGQMPWGKQLLTKGTRGKVNELALSRQVQSPWEHGREHRLSGQTQLPP